MLYSTPPGTYLSLLNLNRLDCVCGSNLSWDIRDVVLRFPTSCKIIGRYKGGNFIRTCQKTLQGWSGYLDNNLIMNIFYHWEGTPIVATLSSKGSMIKSHLQRILWVALSFCSIICSNSRGLHHSGACQMQLWYAGGFWFEGSNGKNTRFDQSSPE